MPEHAVSPEFAGLSRSRRLQVSMDETFSSSGSASMPQGANTDSPPKTWTMEEAKSLALRTLWPQLLKARSEILDRNREPQAMARLQDSAERWALQELPLEPEWPEWLSEEVLQNAAMQSVGSGLLMLRGLTVLEERAGWDPAQSRPTQIRQTFGVSSWVGQFQNLARGVTAYWRELDWPENLNLESLWLVGVSDFVGDRLVIVQGTADNLLKASKGLVRGQFRGEPINLVLNGAIQQLLPSNQAAILAPGALETNLVFLA